MPIDNPSRHEKQRQRVVDTETCIGKYAGKQITIHSNDPEGLIPHMPRRQTDAWHILACFFGHCTSLIMPHIIPQRSCEESVLTLAPNGKMVI